jgi:hypothetical protein
MTLSTSNPHAICLCGADAGATPHWSDTSIPGVHHDPT